MLTKASHLLCLSVSSLVPSFLSDTFLSAEVNDDDNNEVLLSKKK